MLLKIHKALTIEKKLWKRNGFFFFDNFHLTRKFRENTTVFYNFHLTRKIRESTKVFWQLLCGIF